MSSRSCTVTVSLYDSEDREVEVTARYSPPYRMPYYFDKSFGNYLPGDPEEIEVLEIKAVDEGADTEEIRKKKDHIDEAVREWVKEISDYPED